MLSAAKAKAVENEKGYVNLFLSAKPFIFFPEHLDSERLLVIPLVLSQNIQIKSVEDKLSKAHTIFFSIF